MLIKIKHYFKKNTDAAPLAVFRIFFGLMMSLSIVRFWANGWIDKLYVQPKFFFSYYGFEWVKPLGIYTYFIFLIALISAIAIMIGYRYKWSILIFFLSFTYIELMDKTTYLNHYYFISILSFLMIFLPASAHYSIDAYLNPRKAYQKIPKWCIHSIQLLMSIVYVYAGLAKLNSDWLLEAMPLKIWLPSKYDIPLLGDFLQQTWVHYGFSWLGMMYDLSIPFLLLYRPTRKVAFFMVIVFHVLTRVLFPIGMFPFIMIVSATIFFDAKVHRQILKIISKVFKISYHRFQNHKTLVFSAKKNSLLTFVLVLFFTIQLFLPWRYLAYPNELFWTEEGFRFSWRVMLMEKAGYAQFKIVDAQTQKRFYVDNSDFLTPYQEKQMSFQPDFILEYAHFLGSHFEKQGHKNVEVYVESYVALNGRRSQPYIDPTVDLLQIKESFIPKTFILPFYDQIKGL
ncbi:HTTM domain-containing protein [Mesonia sp. K4-1]|uniref:HTTM domain-containing protein n=1 Tax=Mesonia sp. K4-1 TaxID=2602760 RepID=UPI0011CBC67F|nr:HTTM domain-containing protein [Mesonia sp. K4-1]TXK72876.1 HTTM domain-containing protein [Mesonia sp. K4-1]